MIVVPFPPESAASGIGDPAYHPVVWYSREVEVPRRANGARVLLHFGAVDFRAQVWLGGRYLGGHEGGNTPFSFDVTQAMTRGGDPLTLVVRAEDDPRDVGQPRGKQDWRQEPHGIWYHRTTGIWQPVWLEVVPPLHVQDLSWRPDAEHGSVTVGVELNQRPQRPVTVRVRLRFGELMLAEVAFTQSEPRGSARITVPRQSNGQEREWLLWSPEHPRLIDAEVEIVSESGPADLVQSYFGLRSVGWAGGHFLLNDRPYYVRAVLEQAYWPDSHLAAPNPGAFESEVRLIKDLGFNTARLHEAVADPRFLYWADRLGLLIWGENASAYEFSTTAVERTTREWTAVVRRDLSHPCIAVWVPLNESWGVQQIAHDPAQLDYARALYHLTKALDPSRPVVSNDGWEHAESDIWTIHDYGITRAELAANYSDDATVARLLNGIGPLGRRMRLIPTPTDGKPVMVSEFGGISYNTATAGESWGYATVDAADDFEALLRELFEGIQSSPVLAGFCYTQLTDTLQEANGLTDAGRRPKLPVEVIRSIVAGDAIDTSWHGRPKQPVEQPNVLNEEARR
jgi:beta-galactosidase/beta-glucuronidase